MNTKQIRHNGMALLAALMWTVWLTLSTAGAELPDLSAVMEEFRAALPEEARTWLSPAVWAEE